MKHLIYFWHNSGIFCCIVTAFESISIILSRLGAFFTALSSLSILSAMKKYAEKLQRPFDDNFIKEKAVTARDNLFSHT